MVRPILIDLNSIELDYYPFIIRPGNCNRSCNAVITYLQKHVFAVKQNM